MAQSKGKVDWYENDVLLAIEGASDEFLTKLAFQLEGIIKVKITDPPYQLVDTGFMRNSIYAIGTGGDKSNRDKTWPTGEYSWKPAKHRGQEGKSLSTLAPLEKVKTHQSAVHIAASYAIYLETEHQFIYASLEDLQKIAGGTIREVARRRKLL